MDEKLPSINIEDKGTCEHCLNCGMYYNKLICTIYNEDCNKVIQMMNPSNPIFGPNQCKEFVPLSNIKSSMINLHNAYKFMLAGYSSFTLVSKISGKDLNFRLERVNVAGCIENVARANKDTESKIRNKYNSGVFLYNVYSNIGYSNYTHIARIWFNRRIFKFESDKPQDTLIESILFVLNNIKNPRKINWLSEQLEVYHHCKCGYCGNQLETIQEFKSGIHSKCLKYLKTPY